MKRYIDVSLTEIQQDVIVGSLIGDGSLTKSTGNSNSGFVETHSKKQRDYLSWKYEALLPFSTWIKDRTTPALKNIDGIISYDESRELYSCSMGTIRHPIFTKLEREWYARDVNGEYVFNSLGRRIKVIPKNLELTPRMIAVWYLDDGSHNGKSSVTFNTQSFTFNECEYLCDQLKKFGYKTCVNTNREMPVISLWSISYLPFIKMVTEHLPVECMRYKVDLSHYEYNKNSSFGKRITKKEVKCIVDMLLKGIDDEAIMRECNISYNLLQAVRLGRRNNGLAEGNKFLRTDYLMDEAVMDIRGMAAAGASDQVIADKYKRRPSYIKSVRLGTKRQTAGGVLTCKRVYGKIKIEQETHRTKRCVECDKEFTYEVGQGQDRKICDKQCYERRHRRQQQERIAKKMARNKHDRRTTT